MKAIVPRRAQSGLMEAKDCKCNQTTNKTPWSFEPDKVIIDFKHYSFYYRGPEELDGTAFVSAFGVRSRKLSNVRAPPCFGMHVKPLLYLQLLEPTNTPWARVVGYGLCPSGDLNRPMMILFIIILNYFVTIFTFSVLLCLKELTKGCLYMTSQFLQDQVLSRAVQ
jgi:hypothetical protein